jgi:hypothetical protein
MVGRFCPECGAEHEGAKFCPECGTEIGGNDVSDDPSPPESQDTSADEESDDGGLNITLGKIVGYIVGPLLILSALGGLAGGSVVGGLLLLLAGGISLPITRTKLKEKQGLSLSRWATVAVVLTLMIAGGAMLDTGGGGGAGAVDDGDGSQTIEKPATDIVIQLDQLGSGWTAAGSEGNDTHAVGQFYRSEDETVLRTTVDKYDSTDAASSEYETRVNEIKENYGTDSVNVGNEAILYSISDATFVVFRYSNIVVEVQYQKQFALDPEGQATGFAEDVVENANN